MRKFFSSRCVTGKKQGGKVAGKVVGKIRRLMMVKDEKDDRFMGGDEVSSGSVSTAPVSFYNSFISKYSISSCTSESSSEKDPACLTEYSSSPDLTEYDDVAPRNKIETLIASNWGDIVLEYLSHSKFPYENPTSNFSDAPLLSNVGIEKEYDEILSQSSSSSSLTITGNSYQEEVLILDDVFKMEHSGRLRMPNLPGQYEHQKYFNPALIPDVQNQHNRPGVSDMDVVVGDNISTGPSTESTVNETHPHHGSTPKSMNDLEGLDATVANMGRQKDYWEDHRNRSEISNIVGREESITNSNGTHRKQLSWNIKGIHESIDKGMTPLQLHDHNTGRHADNF
ncbi:hypothetical protein SBOR_8480 [Sclerotinia borealis F-4128]|uniref:Uncharacterized protein n=1 Tax=Sclerotinia borealis (strain F-4128) TaxID=1432307 RepID=W9C5I4_SCLBF|nr:hypothetical protein SBOR_8480 [Sclerotinia borealis F-4128]